MQQLAQIHRLKRNPMLTQVNKKKEEKIKVSAKLTTVPNQETENPIKEKQIQLQQTKPYHMLILF